MDAPQIGRPRTIDPDEVSLVALRLFDERGFDAVSMEEVADAASVSRRSLFRLFPTKGALVWGGLDEFAHRFLVELHARPESEPGWSAIRAAYRAGALFPEEMLEVTRHRLRVIHANPSLRHGGDAAIAGLTDVVVRFIAERAGAGVEAFESVVRAHALVAAASAALTWWALHGDGLPGEAVDRALLLFEEQPKGYR